MALHPTMDSIEKLQWTKTCVEVDQCAHLWTIENFKELKVNIKKGECVHSTEFSMDKNKDLKFNLAIYPDGFGDDLKDHIGILLDGPQDCKLHCRFSILDDKNQELIQKTCSGEKSMFVKKSEGRYLTVVAGWGSVNFCTKDDLHSVDSLKILCQVKTVGEITNTKGQATVHGSREPKNYSVSYENLLDNDEFSDFRVITKEREFKVHKCFLATASPVFHSMITLDMKERSNNYVNIFDISTSLVHAMLKFIYTGKVDNLESNARELLAIANFYQIEQLRNLCEDFLCQSLDGSNACDHYVLGHLYDRQKLKNESLQYIINNRKEIFKTESFRKMSTENQPLTTELFTTMVEMGIV